MSAKISNNKNTYLFYLITAIYWYSTNTYIPIITPYLESININSSTIGFIMGISGLSQILLQFPLGILSDIINKRKTFIVLGLFLSSLSSLGMFFTQNPYMLMILRGLTGVAGSSWVIMTILFSSYFSKNESAGKISFLTAANNIGQLIAMLTAGIISTVFAYTGTFIAGAAVGIIGTILSLFIRENKAKDASSIRKIPKITDIKNLLNDKTIIVCSILCLIVQFIAFGATNTFTAKIAKDIGATDIELSVISTIMTIPRIFASMLCGYLLIKKIKSQKIIIASFIIIALACVVTTYSTNMGMIYIGSFLTGAGTGTAYAVLIGICTKNVPDELKSTAMGICQTIFCFGNFLGPIFIGNIIENYSITAGFLFAAILALIAAFYVFFTKDKKKFEISK